jgi:serine/threonine protein kinase
MGEVYRARDTKLKREVAIKTLPEEFSRDPERLARFQREAEALAALNHPNIAHVYGLEESANTRCIVMELVEGETLQQRLTRGPIPVEEALQIAKQIAEALEAAHERGIIHRDLKPGNIMLTADARVKVLDFGLAKALQGQQSTNLSNSPTLLSAASMPGVVIGTAAYMSPEQARGREVDKRTDIFAFGCVLYEMLSGRPTFQGEDVTEILGRVVTAEPDWSQIPAVTPEPIRRALRRTLAKDPRRRLGDIRDARLEIEDAFSETAETKLSPKRRRNVWLSWVVTGTSLIATFILGIPAMNHLREVSSPEMRLQIETPPSLRPNDFALSPDGRYIVYVSDGRLWLRPLSKADAQPMAGTENAGLPFWSADSRSIGFMTPNKLYRIDIAGGPPRPLANVSFGTGGTWNTDGTILYSPGGNTPLWRVPGSGGEAAAVTRLNPPREAAHRVPHFLPDGRHFTFIITGAPDVIGTYLGSLDGEQPQKIAESLTGSFYLNPDLIFIRQGALLAQPFDMMRGHFIGEPTTLADPVEGLSVSGTGIIAYRPAGSGQRHQLTWFDRTGKVLGVAGDPDPNGLQYPELSPDASHVVVQRTVQRNPDIWVLDVIRGVFTRFTFDESNDNVPLWSPDGKQIAFDSSRKGAFNLYLKPASGAGREKLLLETPYNKGPQDWSRDGRFLLYYELDPKTGRDLWAIDMTGNNSKPFPVVNTPFEERNGQFSPDGRWIAYETNESGQFEIDVQAFPEPNGKWQVSTGGGVQPRWRADGKEIYFIAPDAKLMAVPIEVGVHQDKSFTFEAGKPVALFSTRITGGFITNGFKHQYAVSRDGRFLINQPSEEFGLAPITVILNWKSKP